ncbi:MAG: hypothetical protein VB144_12345 [Clostridia bacterium]|nr:hypothetical protein [Clostridia bacterium]
MDNNNILILQGLNGPANRDQTDPKALGQFGVGSDAATFAMNRAVKPGNLFELLVAMACGQSQRSEFSGSNREKE